MAALDVVEDVFVVVALVVDVASVVAAGGKSMLCMDVRSSSTEVWVDLPVPGRH